MLKFVKKNLKHFNILSLSVVLHPKGLWSGWARICSHPVLQVYDKICESYTWSLARQTSSHILHNIIFSYGHHKKIICAFTTNIHYFTIILECRGDIEVIQRFWTYRYSTHTSSEPRLQFPLLGSLCQLFEDAFRINFKILLK